MRRAVEAVGQSRPAMAQRRNSLKALIWGLHGSLHFDPDVFARRVADRFELAIAGRASGDFLGGLLGQPPEPVGPPGARRLGRRGDPFVEIALDGSVGPE